MIAAIVVAAIVVFATALLIFSDGSSRRSLEDTMRVVFIVSIVAAFVIVPVGYFIIVETTDERPQAEEAARAWASAIGFDDVRVTCANRDTNSDGYVSCTLSGRRGGVPELVPVECARSTLNLNDGCRLQRAGMVRP